MESSISSKIVQRKNTLENAISHNGIRKNLSAFGYDRKKLLEGLGLNNDVNDLQLTQTSRYGSQYDATDALETEIAQTKEVYGKHLTLARMAFKQNRGFQAKLQLTGRRKTRTEEWLSQAMAFYAFTDEIAEPMSKYGITPEVLQQTRAMVEALFTTKQQQMQNMGEAQNATEKRNDAIKVMDAWMKDFNAIARLAIKDNPQWLEMLGIRVKGK